MIYLQLFLEFLKIGAFTFGGGYAMLPLVQETVIKNGWLKEKQIIDFIAVSESTPGPFAVNMSTYIGTRTGGFFGAFAATLGIVLPSFFIILVIAGFYQQFQSSKWAKGVLTGLRPAVVGLIMIAAVSVGKGVFDFDTILCRENVISFIIVAIDGIMVWKKKTPLAIIFVSAMLGLISGCLG